VQQVFSPSSVEDFVSKLPQRVAAPQLEALFAETLQHLEMIAVNVLVALIGKRYSDPGAITPLVDAALNLKAFCKERSRRF
jgi:hypothetical protein